MVEARRSGENKGEERRVAEYRAAQRKLDDARDGMRLSGEPVARTGGDEGDTNYIFLSFVTRYLPPGLVGLVIAVIFAAAMSASSGEINSLATVTVIDVYRRHFRPRRLGPPLLWASALGHDRGHMLSSLAGWGKTLGSLIVAVNVVGSFFYGTLLGVFVLAFGFRASRGTAAFWGMLAGEVAIFSAFIFTKISFLWYNVIGTVVVVVLGVALAAIRPPRHQTV